ncbi:MAG: hypothetical protein KDH96_07235, partial [Candidatus Riesia sp.]|nr:hypothetical protein [Candidatus Riesia sp.]
MAKLVRHTAPRDIPNGFIINENNSLLSFIVPENGENLYYRGVDGWQFLGASPGYLYLFDEPLFNTQHGYIQPTTNQIMFGKIYEPLQSNSVYTFSFWCKRTPGSLPNKVNFFIGTSPTQIPASFTPKYGYKEASVNDYWSSYELTFYTNQLDQSATYYMVFQFPDGGEFFMDGFQLENSPYRTTYITGDNTILKNSDNYYWSGLPNNSTSIRLAHVSGGRPISFYSIGFNLIEAEGLGLPDFTHSNIELPLNPIQLYQGSIPDQRDITFDFVVYSQDLPDLLNKRKQLIKQLKDGRLHIQLQLIDCDGTNSDVMEATLLYDGGANLTLNSFYGEEISLDFTSSDPYLYKIGIGCDILSPVATGNANFLTKNNGVWSNMPSPINGIWSKLIMAEGGLYALFRTPDVNTPFLYRYDFKANVWTPLLWSAAASQNFFDMVLVGNDLYICGKFGKVNAPVGTPRINGTTVNLLKYNIPTNTVTGIFQSMTGTTTPFIYSLELLPGYRLAFGGHFTSLVRQGSTVTTKHVAIYNLIGTTVDYVLLAGINDNNGIVYSMVDVPGNQLLVGGSFTANGTSNLLLINNIHIKDYTTHNAFAAGAPNGAVYSLAKDNNNVVYVGGSFSNANTGQSTGTQNVGNYNSGVTPVSIGKMVNNYTNIQGLPNGSILNLYDNGVGAAYELTVDNDGMLYVVGYFNYYGQLEMNGFNGTDTTMLTDAIFTGDFSRNCSSFAKYNTNTQKWEQPSILYDSEKQIYDVLIMDDEAYKRVGIDIILPVNGQYKANNEVTIYIDELASPAYPNISVIGGLFSNVRITDIISNTAGLHFNRYLTPSERLSVELRGLLPKVTSSIYGELNGQLLYGSSPKQFILYPGYNNIKLGLSLDTVVGSDSPILIVVYNK